MTDMFKVEKELNLMAVKISNFQIEILELKMKIDNIGFEMSEISKVLKGVMELVVNIQLENVNCKLRNKKEVI